MIPPLRDLDKLAEVVPKQVWQYEQEKEDPQGALGRIVG